jgi:hypothetical protein
MGKASMSVVFTLAVTSAMLAGNPWLVLYQNSTKMLLYNNHEVQFLPQTQTIAFLNPAHIHSFFPLTYVLSRIYFLLVPSPILGEFVFPMLMTAILLAVLLESWTKAMPGFLRYLGWFAVGALFLDYNGFSNWLWFRSVGGWELLVFLVAFRSVGVAKARNTLVAFTILILSMVMSDEGIIAMAAVFFLLFQASLCKQERKIFARWIGLFFLLFVGYGLGTGFIGEVYYGSFVPVIQRQLIDLLTFNVHLASRLSYLALPLFQVVGSGLAFFVMFGVVPVVLAWTALRNGIPPRSLVLSGSLLVLGVGLRLSNLAGTSPQYISALYGVILFLLFPLSILSVSRGTLLTHQAKRQNKGHWAGLALIFLILISVFVMANFQLNPVVPAGKVTVTSDARMRLVYIQAGGIYVGSFAHGPVSTEQISDISTLFVNPSTRNSSYYFASPLYSIYQGQQLRPAYRNLYYSSGPIGIEGLSSYSPGSNPTG